MPILALNPYHGGSHAAFIDGWRAWSRHAFDLLTLPAHNWKWRMRHAAITFAELVRKRFDDGMRWNALWCTDMLDLAAFRGLCPAVADLPAVAYFHENQLTYPVQHPDQRDVHFAFTNFTTALAADAVWFNSDYHRHEFLRALRGDLKQLPDHQPVRAVDRIDDKSLVMAPGIEPSVAIRQSRKRRTDGPMHLVWAARWEHDKNPTLLFDALDELMRRGVDFRVSVIGQAFREAPAVFGQARQRLGDRVVCWGYQPSRLAYEQVLAEADVYVSTADHEFFGIAAVEAAVAGCTCVLPRRLAYPEVFGDHGAVWYDGTWRGLVAALTEAERPSTAIATRLAARYGWPTRAADMDEAIDALIG